MSWIKRSLYLSPETSSYAQARPADSTFRAIPVTALDFNGGPENLEPNRIIGRTGRSAIVAGGTTASGSFTMELTGLAAQGGDGDSPSAEDSLDLVLGGVANGTALERDGEGVQGLTGTPAVALTLDTDTHTAGDLVCIEDASGNVAWAGIAADAADGSYTLDFEPRIGATVISATSAVTRPIRMWVEDNANDNSRSYNAAYQLDQLWREIPGVKLNSLSMDWSPRQFATLNFGAAGANFTDLTAPTFTTGTNGDPSVLASPNRITGCLYVDGVRYATATLSVDFGLDVQEVPSTCEESGRTDMVQNNVMPTITVSTPILNTWRTLMENKAIRDIKIVSGHSGPSACVWFPNCQVSEVSPQDTNGRVNQSVTFMAIRVGAEPLFVIARS